MNYDVICIGAALIDMVARVERHPLEDDEVFVSNLKLLSGGAAANTAAACAIMGMKTAFIGKLGSHDAFGIKIIEDFKNSNVSLEYIKYSKEYGTGSAYVALDEKGDRRIYAHSGAANYLSAIDMMEGELNTTKLLYLSSLKNIEPFLAAAIIGKNYEIPVILNPGMLIIDQGFHNISQLLKKITILILSFREFTTLMKLEFREFNLEKIQENALSLLKLGIRIIIITLGDKGACLIDGNEIKVIPSHKVPKVIDTTGAGDAFSAGFMYQFTKKIHFEFQDLINCIKVGNFVAGRCIQEMGARNGLPEEKDVIIYFKY